MVVLQPLNDRLANFCEETEDWRQCMLFSKFCRKYDFMFKSPAALGRAKWETPRVDVFLDSLSRVSHSVLSLPR